MAEAVANQNSQQQTQPQNPPEQTLEAQGKVPEVRDERVSSKLQVLVQREKQALEVERRAKLREADLEAKLKAFEERERKVSDFESLKTKDPMKALELLGLSYQDLTQTALNDGSVPPEIQVRKVEEKLDSYLKAQEAAERQRAEDAQKQAKQQEEKIISDFRAEINSFIDSDPKSYELIKFEGLTDLVYDIVDEHYSRTINPETGIGEILSIKDAADKLETQLEKKYNEAKKLSKLNTQPQQLASQLANHVVKPQTFTERPRAARTLTNQNSATPSKPITRTLTDDERIAKAVAYARGLRT